MPIFEYRCQECSTQFEVLHKSTVNQEDVSCPECKSGNNKKLLSSFSASMGSSSSDDNCAAGTCGLPAPAGGCAGVMCGLN